MSILQLPVERTFLIYYQLQVALKLILSKIRKKYMNHFEGNPLL